MHTTTIRGHFLSFCVAATLLAAGCVADAAPSPEPAPVARVATAEARLVSMTPVEREHYDLAVQFYAQAAQAVADGQYELVHDHDWTEAMNYAEEAQWSLGQVIAHLTQLETPGPALPRGQ